MSEGYTVDEIALEIFTRRAASVSARAEPDKVGDLFERAALDSFEAAEIFVEVMEHWASDGKGNDQ